MQYSKINCGMNDGRSMHSDEHCVVVSPPPLYSSVPVVHGHVRIACYLCRWLCFAKDCGLWTAHVCLAHS